MSYTFKVLQHLNKQLFVIKFIYIKTKSCSLRLLSFVDNKSILHLNTVFHEVLLPLIGNVSITGRAGKGVRRSMH